jgi:hypothetical protein
MAVIIGSPSGWGVFICLGLFSVLGMLLDTSGGRQISQRRYFSAMGFLVLGCLGQTVAGYQHFAAVTLVLGIVLLVRSRRDLQK